MCLHCGRDHRLTSVFHFLILFLCHSWNYTPEYMCLLACFSVCLCIIQLGQEYRRLSMCYISAAGAKHQLTSMITFLCVRLRSNKQTNSHFVLFCWFSLLVNLRNHENPAMWLCSDISLVLMTTIEIIGHGDWRFDADEKIKMLKKCKEKCVEILHKFPTKGLKKM